MKKDYATYMTKMPVTESNKVIMSKFMQVWHDYQVKRYVDLKKRNKLGTYDKKDCDVYRDSQVFDSDKEGVFNGKKTTLLDARYARAIDIDIQARVESQMEVKKLEIDDKTLKLEKIEKNMCQALTRYRNAQHNVKNNVVGFSQSLVNKRYGDYQYHYHRFQKLNAKIDTLQQEIDNNQPTIVFGGKKLWRQQFKVGCDIAAWKKAWVERANRFECGGSKSEEWGNKKFQLTFADDYDSTKRARFNLKIQLPYALQAHYGKSIVIENIIFNHGEKAIKTNVENHQHYQQAMKEHNQIIRQLEKRIKETNQNVVSEEKHNELEKLEEALSDTKANKPNPDTYQLKSFAFQVLRKGNTFYCHVSIPRDTQKMTTTDKNGVIGVDINYDNVSYSITNHKGELNTSRVLRFNFGHKNSAAHREQMINQHIHHIVNEAKRLKKHIVIEDLDFTHRKSTASKGLLKDKAFNRMIHALAYKKIKEGIRLRCLEKGVGLKTVNPAYTSMLGRFLYAKINGMSTHQAAAWVIARRYQQYEERFSSKILEFVYKDKACTLTPPDGLWQKQDKLTSFQFYAQVYRWIEKEFKAPSRFMSLNS